MKKIVIITDIKNEIIILVFKNYFKKYIDNFYKLSYKEIIKLIKIIKTINKKKDYIIEIIKGSRYFTNNGSIVQSNSCEIIIYFLCKMFKFKLCENKIFNIECEKKYKIIILYNDINIIKISKNNLYITLDQLCNISK